MYKLYVYSFGLFPHIFFYGQKLLIAQRQTVISNQQFFPLLPLGIDEPQAPNMTLPSFNTQTLFSLVSWI